MHAIAIAQIDCQFVEPEGFLSFSFYQIRNGKGIVHSQREMRFLYFEIFFFLHRRTITPHPFNPKPPL